MWRFLQRWRRPVVVSPPPPPPLPPELVLPPPKPQRQPRLRKRAQLPIALRSAPPFNPDAPPPRLVRDYAAARARQINIANGTGLDGAIEVARDFVDVSHRDMLTGAYHRLLALQADPALRRALDFHSLPPGARPYLLGPYIGSLVGQAYPRLCWTTSNPAQGRLCFIFTGGPPADTVWREKLASINAWLGGAWTIEAVTASTLTLIRRPPLPASIPFAARLHLKAGTLFAGIDVDTHQATHLAFSDLTAGTFIAGASGTGKSNALHVLLQSIFANLPLFHSVYLIDGKDGVAFNRYRAVAPNKVKVLWDEREVWALTTTLLEIMKQRNVLQREAGQDNATGDFIAVVIDEMAAFTAKPSSDSKSPDNKLHARFVDELTLLARKGRSTGLRLFISAQEPVIEQVPASIRANCLTTLAFRLPIDAHANAVFGQLDGLPADPRKLQRGRALLKNGLTGDIRHVQLPIAKN